MKVVLLTNIPTPYRNPVYASLSKMSGINLYVLFCSNSEPNRSWKHLNLNFNHKFLSLNTSTFFHFNKNVIKELDLLKPDVVITSGFTPTMLLAWFWTLLRRKKHIPFTDGTIDSEKNLSFIHKIVRKVIFWFSKSYLGASNKSIELYKAYGIKEQYIFKSVLAVDNKRFNRNDRDKKYDILFSGQLIKRKNPEFFLNLCKELSFEVPGFKALMMGDGALREKVTSFIKKEGVACEYVGFISQETLPDYFKASKIFVFPTLQDPWGLVVNEAMASGLPVITSSFAGCATELVIDNENGYVLDEMDISLWKEKVLKLLNDSLLYNKFSANALVKVQEFNHRCASEGIKEAIIAG